MLTDILTYATQNKAIIIGAAGVLGELVVITVNTVRKIRANKQQVRLMNESAPKASKMQTFLWSANPINLFRKP